MCGNVPNRPMPEVVSVLSRRGFLKSATTATLATAAVGAGFRPFGTPAHAATCVGRIPADRRSIQLYTLRTQSMNDVDTTFGKLVDLGYATSEEAGYGNAGSAAEYKAALDRAGYASTSTHKNIPFPFDEAQFRAIVADAQTIGISRIVEPLPTFALPYIFAGSNGVGPSTAQWMAFADAMNQAGAIAKEELGSSVGYHNHTALFLPVPEGGVVTDTVGMDVLAENTDPELVHFEMDLYWVHAAGQDPVKYVEKYPGRIQQFHVKDMGEDGAITAPGTGIIDFNRIFAAASVHQDIREYIIEQDNAGDNEGGDFTAAELGMALMEAAEWEYESDACEVATAPIEVVPPPSTEPTPAPEPEPQQQPLPATGGGMAGLAALGLTGLLSLRERRSE